MSPLAITVLCAVLWCAVASLPKPPAVLLVSIDGFRYNYFDKHVTPFMDKLRLEGTHTNFTRNVFPTKTFPNHHSIATGVYPEVHGVLGAKVYDPKYGRILDYGYDMFHYNEDIVPIWILNEEAYSKAKGHHSGVMMWPGGDLKYKNLYPRFWQSYNNSVTWETRVDTVMDWFLHPDTPANLVFIYLEDPDRHAHVFGADSPEVIQQIRKVDNITRYIHQSLKNNKLSNIVNVLMLSDHGMDTVTNDTIINLEPVIQDLAREKYGNTPVLYLIPNEGAEDELYNRLKVSSQNERFSVYRKAEIPDRWHFKHNNRTPPILVVADEGYGFNDLYASEIYFKNKWKLPSDLNMTFGIHGYDNEEMNMHSFFMAWGPQIKSRFTIAPFDTVDIYSLLSNMLGLNAPRVNGSLTNVAPMLTNSSSQSVKILGSKCIIIAQILLYSIVKLTDYA